MTGTGHVAHALTHGQGVPAPLFQIVVVVGLLAATVGYGWAVRRARGRAGWPLWRLLCWGSGVACVGAGLVGPLAQAAHSSFTAHMVGHLLVGMLGPLLLVLAAPVTVLLRALPLAQARRLSQVLRARWVRVMTHPVVAACLNGGGLWLLYTTDLYGQMHSSPLVHAVVHTHVVVTGYLFTAAVVGVDPDPHRASVRVRSAVLVVFIASHSILAKWLFAHPPTGVQAGDARVGAQVMYYGGDVVDVVLVVLVVTGWYRATRPREHHRVGADATG